MTYVILSDWLHFLCPFAIQRAFLFPSRAIFHETVAATGSKDGVVKIWGTSTGANLLTLPAGSGGPDRIPFSPDGTRLALIGGVGGVYVFALPIQDAVTLAKSRLTRSLTTEECQQYLHTAFCPVAP